jgi:uncharacterized glyoxalase superfamily protein PhnB
MGVLTPKRLAASKASKPPRIAGPRQEVFIELRVGVVGSDEVARQRVEQMNEWVLVPVRATPLGIEIGLVTDDVAAAVQRAVAAGATLLREPTAKPWGQMVAYVRAPDGTRVELCTPLTAS